VRLVIRALCSSFLLSLAACNSPPAEDTLVVSSDAELRTLAEELLPDLAERAGLELVRPVRLERRSREQLVRYLTARLDKELPPALESRLVRSYALLGLVQPDLDLRNLLLGVYTEQVAGFYDPDSTALFVMEDQPPEIVRTVLMHELVHAVQDQSVDLDSLTARERGSDRQAAAQAAIEGHATLVMLEFAMAQMQGRSVDLSRIQGFGEQLRSTLGAVRSQFPELASAPRVVQESLLFPYLEGAGFVQRVWAQVGTRPPPFGEFLPQSTEQILEPGDLLGSPRDDPQELEVTVPGATVAHSDVLGRLESRLLLEELSGTRDPNAANGWGGDRYVLAESSGGDALAWVSVWDDAASRDRYQQRLGPHLSRLPAAARLDPADIQGRPGLVLRVGAVGDVEVSVSGGARVRLLAPATGSGAG
jgi:hypothetical protein